MCAIIDVMTYPEDLKPYEDSVIKALQAFRTDPGYIIAIAEKAAQFYDKYEDSEGDYRVEQTL